MNIVKRFLITLDFSRGIFDDFDIQAGIFDLFEESVEEAKRIYPRKDQPMWGDISETSFSEMEICYPEDWSENDILTFNRAVKYHFERNQSGMLLSVSAEIQSITTFTVHDGKHTEDEEEHEHQWETEGVYETSSGVYKVMKCCICEEEGYKKLEKI